ncbi:MAG TPA: hypothetical protein VFL55_25530 [Acetobacteraceae bacterium]|nr:hypothetical protein [Acetobacteraceae bacterium]
MMNPFFLIPAAHAFMRSSLTLIVFGAIVRVIALMAGSTVFKSAFAAYSLGLLLRFLVLL